jgi:hypothetical protein
MKLTEGWMNHKGGYFTADMSDIEMHVKKVHQDVRCPGCRKPLNLSDFTIRRDDDGDISTWSMKHECGADLTIFNEAIVKPTFKQFMMEAASKNPYQVRVDSKGITGDWKDIDLHADSLEAIAKAVGASPVDDKAHAGFGLHELVSQVQDWIGPGPDGHGSTWDEMDFDVESLRNDVLKIKWTFSGMNMRRKEMVKKQGTITIMPGAETANEGLEKLGLKILTPKKKKGKGSTMFVWGGLGYGVASAPAPSSDVGVGDGGEGGGDGGGSGA